MASVILTVVGTAVGGPVGGMVGGLLGREIDNRLFSSHSSRSIEGPRLKNLSIQTSAYGEPIPLIYGSMRVSGNVIWSTGLKEIKSEETETSGGKGSSQSVTTVKYSYSASFAVALSGRRIIDVGRIWADGKLLRDASGKLAVSGSLSIYDGAEGQPPSPLIEAIEGGNNTNSFRGLSYVTFENLALGEYANRIPNLTFEVIADSGTGVILSDIISDICLRANLEDYDATDLDQIVRGYIIPGPAPARRMIEELASLYHFDVVEQNNSLLFRKLSRPTDVDIASEDIIISGGGAKSEKSKISLKRRQELDLPREVGMAYIDPSRDFQPGQQRARRLNVASEIVENFSVPIVLESSEAKNISEIQLDLIWHGREKIHFNLPPRYSDLQAGDIISLNLPSQTAEFLIEEIELGRDGLECQAVKYNSEIFSHNAVAEGGTIPVQIVADIALSFLHFLDMPSISGDNIASPILFWAASRGAGKWTGAKLYVSRDGGAQFTALTSTSSEAVSGMVDNILLGGPTAYWDEKNEMLVRLDEGSGFLQSLDENGVLGGGNVAWVGGEILQFRNAVLEPDGRYRLSGLLRGRRGTEHLVSSHSAGEKFILLTLTQTNSSALLLSDVGKSHLYKLVSVGQNLDAVAAENILYAGNNLKPFSPVHALGRRDGAGNITLEWIRRSRVGGEWLDNTDVPLGELYEKYDVEILNLGSVVRSLSVSSSNFIYTAALQIEDFGAIQASIEVNIYQISDAVGRGWPLNITL